MAKQFCSPCGGYLRVNVNNKTVTTMAMRSMKFLSVLALNDEGDSSDEDISVCCILHDDIRALCPTETRLFVVTRLGRLMR